METITKMLDKSVGRVGIEEPGMHMQYEFLSSTLFLDSFKLWLDYRTISKLNMHMNKMILT